MGSTFANDKPDQPPQVTTTVANDVYVRIDWDPPYDAESPILSYSILISDSEGNYIAESSSCSGSDPSITYCDVPKVTLRAEPFNLAQGASVHAVVRAVNLIGEGSYSEPNSVGAIIEDLPGQMATPLRGTSTSETQLHITWTELTGTDTGGAAIDSYNVRWDKGTETWEDIAGEEGDYLVATSYIHSADVSAGAVYKVTVRAHNAHGWGPESAYL